MYKDAVGAPLDQDSATATEQLGTIRWIYDATYGPLAYRYVKTASDTTVANGTALAFTSGYPGGTVTLDISDAKQNYVAGVGIGVISPGQYGWIQCYGYHSAVITNGGDDIAAGDSLILAASADDGMCDSVAAGTAPTYKTLGIAVAADVDAANTVAAFLNCI